MSSNKEYRQYETLRPRFPGYSKSVAEKFVLFFPSFISVLSEMKSTKKRKSFLNETSLELLI